jgi:Uncharacterised protein family (UPF0158)
MLHLADNLIAEIATYAHNGLSVFVHKQTHELAMYAADSNYLEPDDEEYQEVQQNPNDYFQIKGMTPHEAYLMREDFIETVENKSLQDDLKACLYGKKNKFANFKYRVRNSEYEQKWFDFEADAQNEYIRTQLERFS